LLTIQHFTEIGGIKDYPRSGWKIANLIRMKCIMCRSW